MTPLHIDILIHYHTRPTAYGKEDNNFYGSDVRNAINWMVSVNLLESANPADGTLFKTTDRGNAYIDAICSLPLPEKKTVWSVPGVPRNDDKLVVGPRIDITSYGVD